MSKIQDLIREAINELGDVEDELISSYVFRNASKNDLFPLVAQAVRNYDRSVTRTLERRVFRKGPPKAATLTEQHDPEGDRKALYARKAWVPGGGLKPWELLTADEHEARAAFLRGQAASSIESAEQHEKTAAYLRERGVDRLADLPEDDRGGWAA